MEQNKYIAPSDIIRVVELAEKANNKTQWIHEVAAFSLQKSDGSWGVSLTFNSRTRILSLNWYKDNVGGGTTYAVIGDVVINAVSDEFNLRCTTYWQEYTRYQITDLLENH